MTSYFKFKMFGKSEWKQKFPKFEKFPFYGRALI